ncbi:MAG TPA: ABC transporter substrate-binding protein [Conexibacter sp.]|jgi:NitT/TauT family transport system substrate-binding protein/putative hydroxymethylpyrimidine transport system substrate-binding protein
MRQRKPWRLATIAIALVALVAALAGCGGSDSGQPAATVSSSTTASDGQPKTMTKTTLVLDFVPNAIHAGIYRALAAGYYRDNGIDLKVIQPTSTADTLRLIDAGKADFGLADGLDVAGQIDRGLDIQAFMALTQHPNGGVITRASDRIASGRDLEGKTVGITGVPSDRAVLNTIVRNDGGDPSKVKVVTIGFNGVQDLESGRIAGFTGYWPADGVQVQVDGTPTRDFRLDASGGPDYPGLIAFSTRKHIEQDPELVRGFAAATAHGYEDAIRDPQQALDDLLSQNKSLRENITRAQLDAYEPLFQGEQQFGEIEVEHIQELAEWMRANGLIRRLFTPEQFGGNELLPQDSGS